MSVYTRELNEIWLGGCLDEAEGRKKIDSLCSGNILYIYFKPSHFHSFSTYIEQIATEQPRI
jgi:hypothetical protein